METIITMTDEEFRYWHYKLWDWLAETGKTGKDDFPKLKELGVEIMSGTKFDNSVYEAWNKKCFACGPAMINNKNKYTDCNNCPINWGNKDDFACCRRDTLYNKWVRSGEDKEKRKRYANLISQLPWRGKERNKKHQSRRDTTMKIDKTKEEEIREMYKNGCGEIRKVLERLFPNLSKTYPYYGKRNESGKIVYFTKPNCGYVIRKGGIHDDEVGYYEEGWIEELFIPIDDIDKIK